VRCPDGAALAARVDGELVGPLAADLDDHVGTCERCRRAEQDQRQVKWRTSGLRADWAAARPDADLMSVLLTLPQAEHDRALRLAHRARCGHGQGAVTGGRLRIAVIGAGAAVWLVAAVWTSPAGPAPATVDPSTARGGAPSASVPAQTGTPVPVGRWTVGTGGSAQVAGR